MTKPKVQVGDRVEVVLGGQVTHVNGSGAGDDRIRIITDAGGPLWLSPESATRLTVTQPALQVGWHEVVLRDKPQEGVYARYWDGQWWRTSTSPNKGASAGRTLFESIGFLGGAS